MLEYLHKGSSLQSHCACSTSFGPCYIDVCCAGVDPPRLCLMKGQAAALECLAQCMQQSWMCILVGPSGSGISVSSHPLHTLLAELSIYSTSGSCRHLVRQRNAFEPAFLLLCPCGTGAQCVPKQRVAGLDALLALCRQDKRSQDTGRAGWTGAHRAGLEWWNRHF